MWPCTFSWLLLVLSATSVAGQYVLQDDYFAGDFFDHFDFWNSSDPTHGFVHYVDRETASNSSLISSNAEGSTVRMGADSHHIAPTDKGRTSVRISSVKTYDAGLFILDLSHMPGGICGSWPAYWLFGPHWPRFGEIDIIEGIHQQTVNDMTWHTNEGCTLTPGGFTANVLTSDCWVGDPEQNANQGCSTQSVDDGTYGDSFNANHGGVYAMEWTPQAIAIWFFPRTQIPQDIKQGQPDPMTWQAPLSQLLGGENCDISTHFQAHQIVFDITFCGDWAGDTWNSSSCSAKAATCVDFVANNPADFAETYWLINSLKVYANGSEPEPGQAPESEPAHQNTTTPAPPSNPLGNSPNRKPAPKGRPAATSADNKFLPLSPYGSPNKEQQKLLRASPPKSARRSRLDES